MAAAQANGVHAIPTTTSALARVNSVEPSTMAELKDFAKMAAESRFFGAETPQQALILAMAGKDLGFSYTQALRAFHVIKGKPTLSADGMVAAVLQHRDLCEYFRPVRVSDTEAVWVTKPKGGEPIEYRFTVDDATRAGLVNEMYRKHPKRMLSARCKAYLARDVYPQILMGLITDDEATEVATTREPQAVDPRVVEAVAVDDAPPLASEAEVTHLFRSIEDAADEGELRSIGKAIVDAAVSADKRKQLRAAYAKKRDSIAKRVREAEADAAPDAQEIEGEIVHAQFDE